MAMDNCAWLDVVHILIIGITALNAKELVRRYAMSSKIEVPMQLFQYALNAVEYLALRADEIGSSNVPVADAMRALLTARVVERQPFGYVFKLKGPEDRGW